ncbi:MAG: hypothetical protein GY749_33090 [Desulfobacteraceae bacterium]|nr:hypothetical protein [Desulfobacteraceae bacterium]
MHIEQKTYGSTQLHNTMQTLGVVRQNAVIRLKGHEIEDQPRLMQPIEITRLLYNLDVLKQNMCEKTFIFIGIASYNQSEHDMERAKRQQCPDKLLQAAISNRWTLEIALIDPGYGCPNDPYIQVYHDPGWIQWNGTDIGAKYVRVLGLGHSVTLRSYAVGIPEYCNQLNQVRTIQGYCVEQLHLKAVQNEIEEYCILTGNFYQKKPDRSQSNVFCGHKGMKMMHLAGFEERLGLGK